MKECWRPIPAYMGLYEASNLGNIRSVDRYESWTNPSGQIVMRFRPGKKLILTCSNPKTKKTTSALYVGLCKDGKTSMIAVHKIIASLWVKNPNGYRTIRHRDRNKHNNAASNLEWVPYRYRQSMVKEVWRPIPRYNGLYEVSQSGKVRSIRRNVQRTRTRDDLTFVDYPQYHPIELKPYNITKKGTVYHLHRRTHSGYYGQSDEYVYAEELVRLVFPELFM